MNGKKEDQFEKLARLIKEEGEDIRREIVESEQRLEGRLQRKMDEGFASVTNRLDKVIQPQLDDHAHRIKNLEFKTDHLPSHSR